MKAWKKGTKPYQVTIRTAQLSSEKEWGRVEYADSEGAWYSEDDYCQENGESLTR